MALVGHDDMLPWIKFLSGKLLGFYVQRLNVCPFCNWKPAANLGITSSKPSALGAKKILVPWLWQHVCPDRTTHA